MLRSIGAAVLAVAGTPGLAQTADETAALKARVEAQDATIAGLKRNAVNPLQEGWGGVGRVTFAAVNKPGRLRHVGVSGYVRQAGTAGIQGVQERQLRDRAQPELTGESRLYEGRTGVFVRTRPRHNFDTGGGWGACEIAGRWSRSDLDSHENALAAGGARGGVETDYTAALNWYLNPYLRLRFNYIRADARNLTNIEANKGTTLDIVGLRAHQEF